MERDVVVGIDLGTTNSEIAAMAGREVRVLGPRSGQILPSCVGLSPIGDLLVGQAAKNQHMVYPERTVRSIKRKMGTAETVTLGDQSFTPPEISAMILRELAEWGKRSLGAPVEKAVITVPAYFSDAQRTATRDAGRLAGLEVLRILNEPTAASLAYGFGEGKAHTALVYDLGGGTFDVSVVTVEGDVTEVLASHGNNRLGGDDFDDLLLEYLEQQFEKLYGIDLRRGHAAAHARLWWAAEEAKKTLSFEPYAMVREEALVIEGGKPLHLSLELTRERYEQMIRPLVTSTLDSVSQALDDARKRPSDLDAILLVGGSTRTPLVSRLLVEKVGLQPRQDVHPDLCVALGAGVLASRLAGHDVDRVLVDVSPYSFGPSHLGERDGEWYPYCYHPVITRNTPLPVTRTERYSTCAPYQQSVQVEIFQGDDEDALKNILVGEFHVDGLKRQEGPNEVLCRMSLDLDGILNVTAIEKQTGLSKSITIANALQAKSDAEIAEGRTRLQELFVSRTEAADLEDMEELDLDFEGEEAAEEEQPQADVTDDRWPEARELVKQSYRLLDRMHAEDADEVIELNGRLESAIRANDPPAVESAAAALKELLFFVEGR